MIINKLVEDFEEAVRDHARKGGGDPRDVPAIEAYYKETKEALLDYVEALIHEIKGER